jgi:predicted thioesterase
VAFESPELSPGLRGQVDAVVTEEMTAERIGSGHVPVLATPTVLALVEQAAMRALDGRLPDNLTTVGASVTLDHLAPTPVGALVNAEARLESVEDRQLQFAVEVADPAGVVARGTHVRVIVGRDRFLEAVAARVQLEGRS